MSYTLGGIVFSSKAKIKEYAQLILREPPEGRFLNQQQFSFVYDLLLMHPEAQQKIGVGIDKIKVEKHLSFSKNCGFTIYRVNGTTEDFSYKACLESSESRRRLTVTGAFRLAVVNQVIEAKASLVAINQSADGRVWSEIEQDFFDVSDLHLDHYPKPFSLILHEFLKHFGKDLLDVETFTIDGIQNHIKSNATRELWQDWHLREAQYRLISATLNTKLGAHKVLEANL